MSSEIADGIGSHYVSNHYKDTFSSRNGEAYSIAYCMFLFFLHNYIY